MLCLGTMVAIAPFNNAQAQEEIDIIKQYDPDFRPSFMDDEKEKNGEFEEIDEIFENTGLISSAPYQVEYVRLPDAKPGDVTLRIVSPASITGCINVTQPTAEVKATGRTVKIEITDARLTPDRTNTEYSLHSCKVSTGSSKIDITLKREALIQQRINRIMLEVKNKGPFLNMKLRTDKEKAFFIADILDLARMGLPYKNAINKTVYWFYPENTVLLFNSSLKMTDDNIRKIIHFARTKGLTPLTTILPDFRTTKRNRHKLYFVDTDGIYADQIETINDVETLGNIEMEEVFHGPEGPYKKTSEKSIFIKRPGLYE